MRPATYLQPHTDARFVLTELAHLALEIATVEQLDTADAMAKAMRQLDALIATAEADVRFVPTQGGPTHGYH